MARKKMGVNRAELMREVHEKCRKEIPIDVKKLEMTVTTVRGEKKTYYRRVLTRNLQAYRECIAREIRNALEAKLAEILRRA